MKLLVVIFLMAFRVTAGTPFNVIPEGSVFVAEGDSQTAGAGYSSWATHLTNATLLNFRPFVVYTNTANNGQNSGQMSDAYTNEVRIWTTNGYVKIFALLSGANDGLEVAGHDSSTILTKSNLIWNATNNGFNVLHFTVPLRGGDTGWSNATWRANWTNVNRWIRTNTLTTWVVDLDLVLTPSSLGDSSIWEEALGSELHWKAYMAQVIATNVYRTLTTNGVVIGNSAQISFRPADYWSFHGDTPVDGTVHTINPPLFKWPYSDTPQYSEHQNDAFDDRKVRTFTLQHSTNNFTTTNWNIGSSNNFYNFLAPITNADGSTYTGSNWWRVVYYNSNHTVITKTSAVHHFTISASATNWDRSMFNDPLYMASVTTNHPHMLFWATNRLAASNYLRNTYTESWGWVSLSNLAWIAVTNAWFTNENVFTNLANPQEMSTYLACVGLIGQLDINASNAFAPYNPGTAMDMYARWWMNVRHDQLEAYAGGLEAAKYFPLAYDWLWGGMTATQRTNCVWALEKTAQFYVMRDSWFNVSANDLTRVYDWNTRSINAASAAYRDNSHGRHDIPTGLMMTMAIWSESPIAQEMFVYFMNHMLAVKDPGRQSEGHAYAQSLTDSSRTFAADAASVFLFRAAKLEMNPLFTQYMSQLSYMEPILYRQVNDPWGDLSGDHGHAGNNSLLLYGNKSAQSLGLLTGNGAVIRHYNRFVEIFGGTGVNIIHDLFPAFYFSAPTEANWSSSDWFYPDQGKVIASTHQPNDYGAFTNSVTFITEAFPGTHLIDHGVPTDGAISLSAYGAQISGGGVGDYLKHPLYYSGIVYVDGIGPNRIPGDYNPVARRAFFTGYTNHSDFVYSSSDITAAYSHTNYSFDYLSYFEPGPYFYQFSTNTRPYLTSMKRNVLFPHRKYLVLYDTMTTTQAATFQWSWKMLERTYSIDTNNCSFSYTVTNFWIGSNVTCYVVPIVNPSLMTLTNTTCRTNQTNQISIMTGWCPDCADGKNKTYTWNGAGSYTNAPHAIYFDGAQWHLTNATARWDMRTSGSPATTPHNFWHTNGDVGENPLFMSDWTDDSYFNPFTGERHTEVDLDPALAYPRYAGNVWVYNKTPTTNWHFGWVVYPVKWGETAPTITRLDDYTVRVLGANNGVSFADVVTADTNYSGVFTHQFDPGATNAPPVDSTPPTLTSAHVNGTTWTLSFSEAVSIGSGGNGGFAPSVSGGTCTLTYASGSGSSALVYTGSRSVACGETGTIAYTQPGDGIEDGSGNDLANFSGTSVINDASCAPAAPTSLAASPGNQSVSLTWGNPDALADGIHVHGYAYAGGEDQHIDLASSATSRTVSSINNGTLYEFIVTRTNAYGSASDSVQATPTAPTGTSGRAYVSGRVTVGVLKK